MAFTLPTQPGRDVIGDIHIYLEDPDGSNARRSVRGTVRITDAQGRPAENWNGNLEPHLPQEHLLNLVALMNWVRAEAEAKLLEQS